VSDGSRWLRNATAAARLAADRGDLWLAGALGAMGYVAWLPLVLVVSSVPRASDLAFMGAGLFSSELFPLNLLLLATLAALGILIGCLLAALAEATLLRGLGLGTPQRPLTREVEVVFSVILVAVLPAVAVAAALLSGVAAVAPAEFGAPDAGVPLALRIALRLLPLLGGLAILAVAGQALGGVAIRKAAGPEALSVGASLKTALRDLVAHPARRIGLALVSLAIDVLAVVLAVALLRVLWGPIGADLAGGQLISPQALLLLVGFVAVWFAVIFAFGALHVWISAWWSLELGALGEQAPVASQQAHS
jgi:hypothetical protein